MKRRGFTLIEVIIALGIMVMIAGLAWSTLAGSIKLRDVLAEDAFVFEAGEFVAANAATNEDGIFVRRATDKAEVGIVRTTTTIRTTGHTEKDRLVLQTQFTEHRINFVHDAWKGTL